MNKHIYGLLFLLILASCSNDDESDQGDSQLPDDDFTSTYEVIQSKIWDANCINCHVEGNTFATQSDLILTTDVSYDQLVNRAPNNEAAAGDGLVLLGTEGLAALEKSFLWKKIYASDEAIFYGDNPEYGSIMPLGGEYLTNGELAFIRAWIEAGAPYDGVVADEALLEDETRYEASDFEPLTPPEQGYQFHIEPFEILDNRDREIFTYKSLNNDEPVYIKRVEISMAAGSHHFILYNFPEGTSSSVIPEEDVIRDVYNTSGVYNTSTLQTMAYHQFVSGTQWPYMDYSFPEGVALEVPANSGFDLNSHYANRTDYTMTGEVYANVYTVDASEVDKVARILMLDNQNINLPPREETTLTRSFTFNGEANVFQLFSHAHEHMNEFKVYIEGGERDGELVYVTTDWQHPPIEEYDPPIVMESGTSFRLETTYDNFESRTISWGLLSTDEMMILFGAYY